MNKFELVGRLTQDVILKQSQSGKDYGYMNIAVQRRGGATDFIDVTTFDATARFADKYFKRGSWVSVVGHIATSAYEKDGKKVYATKLVGDELSFCGYNKGDAPQGITQNDSDFMATADATLSDEDIPF